MTCLPSAALMPPCAATVCDRVGNSLVMQAVFRPASARPNAARRPAPPAPTTIASSARRSAIFRPASDAHWWSMTGYLPDVNAGASRARNGDEAITRELRADALNVRWDRRRRLAEPVSIVSTLRARASDESVAGTSESSRADRWPGRRNSCKGVRRADREEERIEPRSLAAESTHRRGRRAARTQRR